MIILTMMFIIKTLIIILAKTLNYHPNLKKENNYNCYLFIQLVKTDFVIQLTDKKILEFSQIVTIYQ